MKEIEICGSCKGEGIISGVDKICSGCNGTGRVIIGRYTYVVPFDTDKSIIYKYDSEIFELIRKLESLDFTNNDIRSIKLKKLENICTCGNPSGAHHCYVDENIVECADCGKQVQN